MFRKIKGQTRALNILHNAVSTARVAQAYLFYGPAGVGKLTAAFYFGMAINCHATGDYKPCGVCPSCKKFLAFSHPDFLFLFPTPKLNLTNEGEIKENKLLEEYQAYLKNKMETPWKQFYFSANTEIHIETIRMLQHRINLSRSEANKKIFVIERADEMNIKAVNAFLKTLEEPPADTVIILTSHKPEALLPTILSRTQKVQFSALSTSVIRTELQEKLKVSADNANDIAKLANGSMEKAFELAEAGTLEMRTLALSFLEFVLNNDHLGYLAFAETFKTTKTQNILLEMISYLHLLLSDIALYRYAPAHVINVDLEEMFERIYTLNPHTDLFVQDIISQLKLCRLRIGGHVNPQLVLSDLFFSLLKLIYPAKY